MNRRAAGPDRRPGVDEKFSRSSAARTLATSVVALLLALGIATPAMAGAPAPDETVATVPAETQPPITANDFIPEDRDITECISSLERPGCGSESRGGWRQTLTLLAIFGGLAIVFGNIARGVRNNRRQQQA